MLQAQLCQLLHKVVVKVCCLLHNYPMKTSMTIEETRRRNLQMLIDESEERTAVALAAKCGTASSYLSQILTQFKRDNGMPRVLGTTLARKMERGCGKPEGWMDQLHDDIDPAESELVNLYISMDEDRRVILLQQAKLIANLGR